MTPTRWWRRLQGRLKETVNLDSVRDDLAAVVHQALEPTLLWVWINDLGTSGSVVLRALGGGGCGI